MEELEKISKITDIVSSILSVFVFMLLVSSFEPLKELYLNMIKENWFDQRNWAPNVCLIILAGFAIFGMSRILRFPVIWTLILGIFGFSLIKLKIKEKNNKATKMPKKLNLGCGTQVIDSWVNVDYSLGARLQKVPFLRHLFKLFFMRNWDKRIYLHNLTKKFPWKENSVDVIYTSHTLEHFSERQGVLFLKECFRVLKNGGILRVVVPDLEPIIQKYLNREISGDSFCDYIMVTYETPKNLKEILLAPAKVPHIHKCMYDHESLIRILNQIGFKAEKKNAFDSKISDIEKIESKDRTENAAIVEAAK